MCSAGYIYIYKIKAELLILKVKPMWEIFVYEFYLPTSRRRLHWFQEEAGLYEALLENALLITSVNRFRV